MKFCYNTNFTFPKQSQRSRSILQDGSRSFGLFWKEKIHLITEEIRYIDNRGMSNEQNYLSLQVSNNSSDMFNNMDEMQLKLLKLCFLTDSLFNSWLNLLSKNKSTSVRTVINTKMHISTSVTRSYED